MLRRGDAPGALRISTPEDAARLIDASRERPVLLFKHSRTCPISAMAWDAWKDFLRDPAAGDVACAYLVVQQDRPASDEIAARLGVRHESPQAILIRRGEAAWHASHGAITAGALARAALAATGGSSAPGTAP